MSEKQILIGTVFVFAASFTALTLLTIGLLWWDHFKQRKDK
jgi:hypothetical protein